MASDNSLQVASYVSQKDSWPKAGNYILAQFDDHSIVVYQAYNSKIAKALVQNQNFHSEECIKNGFSLNRMTWIKTNFLWMMFRSGWASKANQEHILAIRITRTGFEQILSNAVHSGAHRTYQNGGDDYEKFPVPKQSDEVRIQWDPDHLPNGNKIVERRAIQLGIRGQMLYRLSKEFILGIEDITDFVLENKIKVDKKESELMIPIETVYNILNEDLAKRINLTQ